MWFGSYLNGLVVFPTFFNLSLNLAIRSAWSEPQSAPGLVFVDCIELLHLWLQEYNQSDFGIDHLVMSMCRVFSCVVGRGCLLLPVRSLGKNLLAFALLRFVLQGQICLLLQVSLDFLLLNSCSLWWKGCLFIILSCTCTGLGDRKYVLPIRSVTSRQAILFGWRFAGTALRTDSRWWLLQAA